MPLPIVGLAPPPLPPSLCPLPHSPIEIVPLLLSRPYCRCRVRPEPLTAVSGSAVPDIHIRHAHCALPCLFTNKSILNMPIMLF